MELRMNLTRILLLTAALATAASLSLAQNVAPPKADDAAMAATDAKAPANKDAKPTQAKKTHKTETHHAKKDATATKAATPSS
jgi:hypothetical protein